MIHDFDIVVLKLTNIVPIAYKMYFQICVLLNSSAVVPKIGFSNRLRLINMNTCTKFKPSIWILFVNGNTCFFIHFNWLSNMSLLFLQHSRF